MGFNWDTRAAPDITATSPCDGDVERTEVREVSVAWVEGVVGNEKWDRKSGAADTGGEVVADLEGFGEVAGCYGDGHGGGGEGKKGEEVD